MSTGLCVFVSAMKCCAAAALLCCCASLYGRQMSANCRSVYLPVCAATSCFPLCLSLCLFTLSLNLPLLVPLFLPLLIPLSPSLSLRFSACRQVCWGRFSSTFSECLIIKRCHVYVCVCLAVCVFECDFSVCALTRRYTSANIWPRTQQAKPSGHKHNARQPF